MSNRMSSKSQSVTELSPLILCLISAAALGVFIVIVLIAVTTVKRKGSSGSSAGSSSLSSGHHHLFATSDAVIGTKIPTHLQSQHPLISSNCKPLPLVPLIDRESSLYDKVNPCQAPTTQPPPPPTLIKQQHLQSPTAESAVNVIYSEINDYNLDDEEEDGKVLISSSTTGHGGPQLIHLHSGRNQLSSNRQSPTQSSHRPLNYPQFITFNTVGRNSQRNGNPYTFHDSMPGTRFHPQTTTTAMTVASSKNNPVSASGSNTASGVNTYAVYAYEKFARNQRGSHRGDKITFPLGSSSGSSSCSRDRFV